MGLTSALPSPFFTKNPWSYSSRFGVTATRGIHPVGREVLGGFPQPLLVIRRGHDLEVLRQFQPPLAQLSVWRLHDQKKAVEAPLQAAANDDLALPSRAIAGKGAPDRFVPAAVAAQRLERRGYVEQLPGDAQMLRQEPPARNALARGIAFGKQQSVHPAGTDCP